MKLLKENSDDFLFGFHVALRKGSDTRMSSAMWNAWNLPNAELTGFLQQVIEKFPNCKITDWESLKAVLHSGFVRNLAIDAVHQETRVAIFITACIDDETCRDLANWFKYA